MTTEAALKDYLQGLPAPARKAAKDALRLILYRQDVEAWSRIALGIALDPWQRKLVKTPPGGRAICLVHRQAGKTTAAAIATSHHLIFGPPGSTSLVLAPTQRQSGEAIRRIRSLLLKAGAKLETDNAFSLQLENGSRVLGLPGQDDAAIRGLTVDGILVVDEAARVSDALFQAAMPMVLRHARTARVMLLSTAWAQDGFFYRIWTEGDPLDWTKVEARITECTHLSSDDIERERRSMPASVFAREYLNEFSGTESRLFNLDSLAAAFGRVVGPTPEVTQAGKDDDPIVSTKKAFSKLQLARPTR